MLGVLSVHLELCRNTLAKMCAAKMCHVPIQMCKKIADLECENNEHASYSTCAHALFIPDVGVVCHLQYEILCCITFQKHNSLRDT